MTKKAYREYDGFEGVIPLSTRRLLQPELLIEKGFHRADPKETNAPETYTEGGLTAFWRGKSGRGTPVDLGDEPYLKKLQEVCFTSPPSQMYETKWARDRWQYNYPQIYAWWENDADWRPYRWEAAIFDKRDASNLRLKSGELIEEVPGDSQATGPD